MSITCALAEDAKRPAATPAAAATMRQLRETGKRAANRSEKSATNLRHPRGNFSYFAPAGASGEIVNNYLR
jgi:hypothetical protein